MAKYFITTPIYYVNAAPHIGHAYSTIAADALARYHRLRGESVYFLCGTDENSQKNVEAAARAKKDISVYVDEMAAVWKKTWEDLGVVFDDFIRTTEDRHKKGVIEFYERVRAKGDIYKGLYEGIYCVGCEAYLTEKDLVNGACPFHKEEPKRIKEENYFFKLSAYKEPLLAHIKKNPDFIQPEKRRNEIVRYIADHLEDISISRQSQTWGIPLPDDPAQVLYVWFDALLNYCTAVGLGTNDTKFEKWWPADVHLVGKDIIKFHCALWPAMLMSAGLPLPRQVFAHGFFTINGEKISKSLGNAIDPIALSKTWGTEALRYFLLREIPFGEDGDFSETRVAERYEGELANGLGNLVARVTKLAETETLGVGIGIDLEDEVRGATEAYHAALEKIQLHIALEQTWALVALGDAFLQEKQPWKKPSGDPTRIEVLTVACELLYHTAHLLEPFMPVTSAKIFEQLGGKEEGQPLSWNPGRFERRTVQKGESLFPRLNL